MQCVEENARRLSKSVNNALAFFVVVELARNFLLAIEAGDSYGIQELALDFVHIPLFPLLICI